MNILVVGRGGREHAICQKLSVSESVNNVFCAPGNDGMKGDATLVSIDEMNFSALVEFVEKEKIDFTIVGPENPLLAGIVDYFQERKLAIFGPTKKAAEIEGSKAFAKQLMSKYHIPTATFATFTDLQAAKDYVEQQGVPIVIKADGLAAGKGVVIPHTLEEAYRTLEEMLVHKRFGEASTKVVIEEFLEGEEYSLMSFVNGDKIYPLAIAQDHKRAFDGDQGPNTGGMGAYSPVPHIGEDVIDRTLASIVKPVAEAMISENRSFTGILYAGLILTTEGPKVIEFNARFGDPETQVVLPRLQNDLAQVIQGVLAREEVSMEWDENVMLGVVLAAKGYPNAYEKGLVIEGVSSISEDAYVFHAGTKLKDGQFLSNGGRVLLVGAKNTTINQARKAVYQELEQVSTDAFFYRNDIGERAIKNVSSSFERTHTR
ncbi:phosphoribosylamine--glycine ligase [Bacillus spongiae]|uniref:Phosphoribosylamine--glycine ligase n=1 Tax=Bacillus spongiae TaxID=2683610 RepID=A0ABU8HDV7_9BACI